MKKRNLVVIALLLMVALLLAACVEDKLTAIEILQQKYNEITAAKSIEQKITITSGNFTQYERDKTYTKTTTGYSVTGTEKKLNDSSATEAYTVTDISEEVTSVANGTPTLKLDESYFEAGYKLTETGLTATVKQNNIKDVMSIEDDALTSPTSDLTLELSLSGDKLTTVRLSYTSGTSRVTIQLTMSY